MIRPPHKIEIASDKMMAKTRTERRCTETRMPPADRIHFESNQRDGIASAIGHCLISKKVLQQVDARCNTQNQPENERIFSLIDY